MRSSIFDQYYGFIRRDSKYYEKWLELYGTHCIVKKPKLETVERLNEINLSYGAKTHAPTLINYDFEEINLLIQPQDYTRIEVGMETTIPVVSPIKLDDGFIIEIERLDSTYEFEVSEALETYWDILYRYQLLLRDARSTDEGR